MFQGCLRGPEFSLPHRVALAEEERGQKVQRACFPITQEATTQRHSLFALPHTQDRQLLQIGAKDQMGHLSIEKPQSLFLAKPVSLLKAPSPGTPH